MKLVKAFFVMLYIQLALQYGFFPILGYGTDEETGKMKIWAIVFFAVLAISFVAVQIVGCLSAAAAVKMYTQSEYNPLKRSWLLLKLKTIPFYILNFIFGLVYIIFLIGASRGLAVLAVIPILVPIWYTCAFIVQSGFFGAANVAVLRKKHGDSISLIHYVLQFIPILDVISTVFLLRKSRKQKKAVTIEENAKEYTEEMD